MYRRKHYPCACKNELTLDPESDAAMAFRPSGFGPGPSAGRCCLGDLGDLGDLAEISTML